MIIEKMVGDQKKGFPPVCDATKMRRTCLMKRTKGLKKKLFEFSTLCDVDACMLWFGSEGEICTWPEKREEFDAVVERYKNQGKHKIKKNNKKIVEDDQDQEDISGTALYHAWEARLDLFSEDSLREFGNLLDSKLEEVRERAELVMRKEEQSRSVVPMDHQQQPFQAVFPSAPESDLFESQLHHGQFEDEFNQHLQPFQAMLPSAPPPPLPSQLLPSVQEFSNMFQQPQLHNDVNLCDNYCDRDFDSEQQQQPLQVTLPQLQPQLHDDFGDEFCGNDLDLDLEQQQQPLQAALPQLQPQLHDDFCDNYYGHDLDLEQQQQPLQATLPQLQPQLHDDFGDEFCDIDWDLEQQQQPLQAALPQLQPQLHDDCGDELCDNYYERPLQATLPLAPPQLLPSVQGSHLLHQPQLPEDVGYKFCDSYYEHDLDFDHQQQPLQATLLSMLLSPSPPQLLSSVQDSEMFQQPQLHHQFGDVFMDNYRECDLDFDHQQQPLQEAILPSSPTQLLSSVQDSDLLQQPQLQQDQHVDKALDNDCDQDLNLDHWGPFLKSMHGALI